MIVVTMLIQLRECFSVAAQTFVVVPYFDIGGKMAKLDKRETERVKLTHFFVQYKMAGATEADAPVFTVEVLNISARGICFLRNSVLYKNDEILILFPFKTRKLTIHAKVIRVEGKEVAAHFSDKEDKIDLMTGIFNKEYKVIMDENRMSLHRQQSLFGDKDH